MDNDTIEALLSQPTISLKEAARILGVGDWAAYKAVAEDTFPVPVIRVRRSIRVPTAPLRETLQGDLNDIDRLRRRVPTATPAK